MTTAPYTMNGTMVTDFLATLNTSPCFAGHCDWRIPNVRDLQSIIDYGVEGTHCGYGCPQVSEAFNTNCTDGCTVDGNGGPMCSCTALNYWSSTTSSTNVPRYARYVVFFEGNVDTEDKGTAYYVRGVCGGS